MSRGAGRVRIGEPTASDTRPLCSHHGPIIPGEMYCGYACDAAVRDVAASGGVVTAILLDLLERREIDAALVSRITGVNGSIRAVSELARTREEVLRAAGSAYVFTPVLKQVKKLVGFAGRVAIVALPCQAARIRRLTESHPDLKERIAWVIGLFCRGAVSEGFYRDFLRREGLNEADVEQVRVARRRVTGEVVFGLRGGERHHVPFLKMNAYRIAGAHYHFPCLCCAEHLAASADLSVGDIFAPEYKSRPIRHSALVCRTAGAAELADSLRNRAVIAYEFFGMERYKKTFARLERFSNTLGARVAAGKLTGLRVGSGRMEAFDPFHAMAWTIVCMNHRLSRTKRGRRFLYALPSPIIQGLAMLVKGLARL